MACWSSVVGGTGGGVCSGSPAPSQELATQATYSSSGTFFLRMRTEGSTTQTHLLYFAGHPISTMVDGTTVQYYLSSDHLGSPSFASSTQGSAAWEGGLEPFGKDYSGSLAAGVFLRYPGQWVDYVWGSGVGQPGSYYYNAHRWYDPVVGRYTRLEPVRWLQHSSHYLYAQNRPLFFVDPGGLDPCANLSAPPLPGSCCGEGLTPIAGAFQNVLRKRALYCANREQPPIVGDERLRKGWIEITDGVPTAHYTPQGNPCIDWCVCQHEEYHIEQARSGELRGMSRNAAECEAYNQQIKCLLNLTRSGPPVTGH